MLFKKFTLQYLLLQKYCFQVTNEKFSVKLTCIKQFSLKFFNWISYSILFCISFRCTAYWLDNHILYKVVPSVFQLPTWHHPQLLQHYWLYFLCCALCPHDYCVTTNLNILIPTPFHPFLQCTPSLGQPSVCSLPMYLFPFCLFFGSVLQIPH